MRAAVLVLLLASPAAADPIAEAERFQQGVFDAIAPSVVYLISGDSIGSGFFVDGKGLVLTNRHVVGARDVLTAVLHDGRRLEAKVLERAEKADLALVQIKVDSKPLTLGSGGLRVGSWVAAVGHGMGGAWTFTTGMVSNIYPHEGGRPVFQTQIPLNPGASGGPVVDRHGQVVGIVAAGIPEASSINFAIRSEVALQTFAQLEASCACIAIEAPSGASVLVDGQLAGKGPRVVVPASPRTYRIQAIVAGALQEQTVRWPERRRVTFSAPPGAPREPVKPR